MLISPPPSSPAEVEAAWAQPSSGWFTCLPPASGVGPGFRSATVSVCSTGRREAGSAVLPSQRGSRGPQGLSGLSFANTPFAEQQRVQMAGEAKPSVFPQVDGEDGAAPHGAPSPGRTAPWGPGGPRQSHFLGEIQAGCPGQSAAGGAHPSPPLAPVLHCPRAALQSCQGTAEPPPSCRLSPIRALWMAASLRVSGKD